MPYVFICPLTSFQQLNCPYRVLKPKADLVKLNKGASPDDYFIEGILQRYERRIVDLESEDGEAVRDMALATFAVWYKRPTKSQAEKDGDGAEGDGDGPGGGGDEEEFPGPGEDPCPDGLPQTIHLEGGGTVVRRKRKGVLRYHRFDPKKDEGEEFYYSHLVLFCPFQKEDTDLSLQSTGFPSYKAFFKAKEAAMKPIRREFEAFAGPIAAAYDEMDRERQDALDNRLAANVDGPAGDGQGQGQPSLIPTLPSSCLHLAIPCRGTRGGGRIWVLGPGEPCSRYAARGSRVRGGR